ncbi:hypothetical protein [Bosea sp. 117]|uniref:hypothetical protein n=1 Tax=Bosea sp. 117 TaxID=1125973 RepID=UPI0012DF5F35|nr:hypothetical protein [Bosea sp. 117]
MANAAARQGDGAFFPYRRISGRFPNVLSGEAAGDRPRAEGGPGLRLLLRQARGFHLSKQHFGVIAEPIVPERAYELDRAIERSNVDVFMSDADMHGLGTELVVIAFHWR